MSHKTRQKAFLIRNNVCLVHTGHDQQIIRIAELIGAMAEASLATGAHADIADEAMLEVRDLFSLEVEARHKAVKVHECLARAAGRVGITELAVAGDEKLPWDGLNALKTGQAAFEVVRAAA